MSWYVAVITLMPWLTICTRVYIAAKALIDTINSFTKEDGSEEKLNSAPVRLLIFIDELHEMMTPG